MSHNSSRFARIACIKKNRPKNYISGQWRGAMKLKSQNSQKVHLKPIINLHTKFQLPISIWRTVMRGSNSKNRKNSPKNYIFVAVRRCNEAEKSRLPKDKSRAFNNRIYQISTSYVAQFWRKLWEIQTQNMIKPTQKPHFRGCEEVTWVWIVKTSPSVKLLPFKKSFMDFNPELLCQLEQVYR